MFPLKNRITSDSDFYKIKKHGKRIFSSFFSISFITQNDINDPLFSVIVSKKIAKKSTDRNKLKRVTKGIVQRNLSLLPNNIKCIIFPKFKLLSINNKDREVEFLKLLKEINP
jgi:ribonuclease P protein component